MKKEGNVKVMSENKEGVVWETKLPLPLAARGKVRDIYAVGDDRLLIVTTDRLSAFDVVLPTPIPDKGKVLNQISLFWFGRFRKVVPNHLLAEDVEQMGLPSSLVQTFGEILSGRSVLVHRAKPLPVECVVRGYLAGSGWKDYQKIGAVCGHQLPKGLKQCGRLPQPLFTPATKASVGHDQNIDFNEVVSLVGEKRAVQARDLSLKLYQEGTQWAEERGIIIADTKFEFGVLGKEIILIDEVLTPDSSRFWSKEKYLPGQDQPSFDKQIVRNFLLEIGWDQKPPGPMLPVEVVEKTRIAYGDVFTRLTGKKIKS